MLQVSWTEILYIFVVLFLVIYGVCFIVRRTWAFFNCMRSGCARVWLALAADRADSVFYGDAQLS